MSEDRFSRRVGVPAGTDPSLVIAAPAPRAPAAGSAPASPLPIGLAPGLPELRATVTAGGAESSGRTLLEVAAR